MKAQATLILVWLLTGAGAVGGSILGAAVGQGGLFAGAVLGGWIGGMIAVWLCVRFRWLAPHQRFAASIGAALGFFIATPIAVLNLDTPVIPVLICSLAGAGALVGAGLARAQ